ncbi:hypothetical protein DFJ77DRAFT_294149 [Powellomyces hirtus]|nr:hypothetical protein DFJ77DRAFT_294149 [Powellomyces hirtus]
MVSFSTLALALTAASGVLAAPAAGSTDVVATHGNAQRNLAQDGWGSATVCSVYGTETVCFDTQAEADAHDATLTGRAVQHLDARAPSSCGSGWGCIYDSTNYGGRKLQWRDRGVHNLGDWGFSDKTSSVYNNRGGSIKLTNVRGLRPDINKTYAARTGYASLGDFSNTADRITLN